MTVTFISECEKNAIAKTQRILDTFANRIGSRTWQTVITADGLASVKKQLKKVASKNTSVACHWHRSRVNSELVWIVGNRDKFSDEGYVPVHLTERNLPTIQDAGWPYHEFLKAFVGLAAIFHDFGKANNFFQKKIRKAQKIKDPLRHEWLSCLIVVAFIRSCFNTTDIPKTVESDLLWLDKLKKQDIDIDFINNEIKTYSTAPNTPLFQNLPPLATILCWLILTHHRLPLNQDETNTALMVTDIHSISLQLEQFTANWWYQDSEANNKDFNDVLSFNNGLLFECATIKDALTKWANRLIFSLTNDEPVIQLLNHLNVKDKNLSIRPFLHFARIALVLGDHHFSSLDKMSFKTKTPELWANPTKDKQPKQFLDEHLFGVCKKAVEVAHFLPKFWQKNHEFNSAYDVKMLKPNAKTPDKFKWQNKAANKITSWRNDVAEQIEDHHFPFFAVNMASTGCGKTIANAKIMQRLSVDGKSLRYNLALGLRTLTLQTGDEYRRMLGLDNTDLAVKIGSKAVLELHGLNTEEEDQEKEPKQIGSESAEDIIEDTFDYSLSKELIVESKLKRLFKADDFTPFKVLQPSVYVSTIDHLMGATETKKGGRFILPSLRLMSSDLVIDEVDDFAPDDLVCIGRLIHLAAMFGRKVMISSATIPPAIAKAFFYTYIKAWQHFQASFGGSFTMGCAFIDEKRSTVNTINIKNAETALTQFEEYRTAFVEKRVNYLSKIAVRRKAIIKPTEDINEDTEDTIIEQYSQLIRESCEQLHHDNHTQLENGKYISFGVIRVANINPCIGIFKALLDDNDWSEDVDVRLMPYHSRQVLILRNDQERHLDKVLKRKTTDEKAFLKDPIISQHIQKSTKKHLLFIVVATPVEEVGRDHDFDWAIIEPSSVRSIIQMAGRVLRHRDKVISEPNIHILEKNILSLRLDNGDFDLKSNIPTFCKPGFETDDFRLEEKSLFEVLEEQEFIDNINSIPKIISSNCGYPESLIELEHSVLESMLDVHQGQESPNTFAAWIQSQWWMSAMPQKAFRFRNSAPTQSLFLLANHINEKAHFYELDANGDFSKVEKLSGITILEDLDHPRLWLPNRDFNQLIEETANRLNRPFRYCCSLFGEIQFPKKENAEFSYCNSYGLKKN